MRLLVCLLLGTIIWLNPSFVLAQSIEKDQARIEKKFGHPFSDVVRLNYWSVFERGNEFAQELGINRAQLDALIAKHSWELKPPPALTFQNTLDSDLARALKRVTVSSRQNLKTGDFVGPSGQSPKSAAHAEIRCDGGKLVITVICPDPNPVRLKAVTPLVDNRPKKVKAFWSGDFAAFKPLLYKGMTPGQETRWARELKKPTQSVLLDAVSYTHLTLPTILLV